MPKPICIQPCGLPPHNYCVQMGHFKYPLEFTCKCGCSFASVDYRVWLGWEKVRLHYGKPVILDSVCRCLKHNKEVGGKSGSDHCLLLPDKKLISSAGDGKVIGVYSPDLFEYMETLSEFHRIGLYDPGGKNGKWGFCHGGVQDRGLGTWRRWHYDSQRNLVSSAVAIA